MRSFFKSYRDNSIMEQDPTLNLTNNFEINSKSDIEWFLHQEKIRNTEIQTVVTRRSAANSDFISKSDSMIENLEILYNVSLLVEESDIWKHDYMIHQRV